MNMSAQLQAPAPFTSRKRNTRPTAYKDRRGEAESFVCFGEAKNLLSLLRNENQFLLCPVVSLVTIPTEQPRLHYFRYGFKIYQRNFFLTEDRFIKFGLVSSYSYIYFTYRKAFV
jgi:hypothetical protein